MTVFGRTMGWGRALAAAGAAVGAMSGGAALAVTVPATITLPPATVFISPADTFDIITAPGTYYNASTDSALEGADPSVSTDLGIQHAASSAQLIYYIELVDLAYPNPGNINDPAPLTVGVNMSDFISTPVGDDFGPLADAFISISAGIGTSGFAMQNCAGNIISSCATSHLGFTTQPFASVTTVNLVPNLVYTVDLEVGEESGGHAEIDPTFTAPAGTYFVYSAGIGAVPEPGTWAMMVLGMGALGFALRRRPRLASVPAFC